jgi:O-antigen/teichoic acid export membrane protein
VARPHAVLAGVSAPVLAPAREPTSAMLRGVARGGLLNLIGAGVAGGAGFAVTWLVARGLADPARVGAFFTATAAFGVGAGVAKLGTQTSLVYWPARLRALGARQELPRCLSVALGPAAAAAVAVGAALLAAADRVPPAVAGSLRVLAVLLPFAVLTDALLAATRGYRAMRPTVLLDRLLRPGLQLAAIGALFLSTVDGTVWYALGWGLPYVPVALLCGYAVVRVHGADVGPSGARVFSTAAYWSFTWPRAMASVAQLAVQRVDVLVLAWLGGLPAAALYAVGGRFVVLGQFVNAALAQAVQPRLAERLSIRDTTGARLLYQQATGWLVLATWPIHLVVAANAGGYLRLFGPSYAAAVPVVRVLAGAMLVATACGMVDMVLAMAGRTRWNLCNVVLALAVMLCLDVLLIPRLGALGAALGLAAAVAVNNLVPLAQVWYVLRLHPFGRATLLAAALAASCFGAPALLAVGGAGGAAPVATTAGGLLCYLAGVVLLRRPLKLHLLTGGRS